MNAFFAGIGKALSIWPQTDYEQFMPRIRPTTEAWYTNQERVSSNLKKIEQSYPELLQVKTSMLSNRNFGRVEAEVIHDRKKT